MKLFCQTIVSWRFVITKTFHHKNHFLFNNFFVTNSFFSWLKDGNEIPLRTSLYAYFIFLSVLLNKFSKNHFSFLLLSIELSISFLFISDFLTVPCVAFVFSRFRKNLVDFAPFSYHWLAFTSYLLLIFLLAFTSYLLHHKFQVDFYS